MQIFPTCKWLNVGGATKWFCCRSSVAGATCGSGPSDVSSGYRDDQQGLQDGQEAEGPQRAEGHKPEKRGDEEASSSALPNGLTSRYLFHPAQQQHPVEFTKTGKTRQTYWEKEIRARTRKCLNQLVASNTCLDHKRSINDGTKAFFH